MLEPALKLWGNTSMFCVVSQISSPPTEPHPTERRSATRERRSAMPDPVVLTGPSGGPFSKLLGKYSPVVDMVEHRHVYVSAGAQKKLWWTAGAWYIGPSASVGSNTGHLMAVENTDIPEDISVPWRMSVIDVGCAPSEHPTPGPSGCLQCTQLCTPYGSRPQGAKRRQAS